MYNVLSVSNNIRKIFVDDGGNEYDSLTPVYGNGAFVSKLMKRKRILTCSRIEPKAVQEI